VIAYPVSRPHRGAIRAAAAAAILLFSLLPGRLTQPVHAASNSFYFHGQATDQANKATTPGGTATFDASAPTGTAPVAQTASPLANSDYAGDPLAAYWYGPYTGTLSGSMQLNWYWSSANATAIALGLQMDITVFADPDVTTGAGTIVGRQSVSLKVGATPTANTSLVPVAGTASRTLLIQAVPHFIDTGNAPNVYYDSTTTPSGFSFVATPTPPSVAFDTTTPVTFAPSTLVSPSFFGGEPETVLERQLPSSLPGRVDNKRIFIDWPLSSRSQTSQLSRSTDGGDRFRELLDLTVCPQRNRPNCATGGGGDSKSEVNLVNGNLYFADQEVLVQEALASSTDHGDSWPATRQFAVTNTASSVDRQWLAYIDPSIASVGSRHVEAFLSYHIPAAGEYIQGIDQDGLAIPQPVPQIASVSQSGSSVVDNSNGPGRGWIYQPYRGAGVTVSTAYAPNYQLPTAWQSTVVSTDNASIFPWVNVDSHGNAYMVWVNGGNLFLSVSPIDDARNNPTLGGRPGSYWTQQAGINPPGVTNTIFPEVTAGDTGRIAIAFDGTTECPAGLPDTCPATTHWNTYVDIIPDAMALARGTTMTVSSGLVSHRVVHRGNICTGGTTCTADRSLLDMIDLGFDSDGRVGVVFTDNNNRLAAPTLTDAAKAGPFTFFAKETQGPSLLSTKPAIAVTIPTNSRNAPAGDATWPNTAAGQNLPSLDLLGASIALSTDGSQVIAQLPIADASYAGMARDLAAYNAATTEPGARIQYTVRFSTADDVFHLDMDVIPGATPTVRFFAGRLDANDIVQNGTGTTVGSRYVADAGYPASGSIRNNVLTLRAPASAFGLGAGSVVTGVSGISFIGPTEQDPTAKLVVNSARTIDATPPFDATLQPLPPAPPVFVDCTDHTISEGGGWHTIQDSRASNGHYCRQVGAGQGAYMSLPFYGSGIDIVVDRGPRGGNFNASIDGGPPTLVELYRPPTNPASPDTSGKQDLTFNVKVHFDVPSGQHTFRLDEVDSFGGNRNIQYVQGFNVYNGDTAGPYSTTTSSATLLNGTLTALIGATSTVFTTASTVDLDFILSAAPGVTLTVRDPSGAIVASGTVQDGILSVFFGPNSIGAYTVDVRDPLSVDSPFELFEVVGSR